MVIDRSNTYKKIVYNIAHTLKYTMNITQLIQV